MSICLFFDIFLHFCENIVQICLCFLLSCSVLWSSIWYGESDHCVFTFFFMCGGICGSVCLESGFLCAVMPTAGIPTRFGKSWEVLEIFPQFSRLWNVLKIKLQLWFKFCSMCLAGTSVKFSTKLKWDTEMTWLDFEHNCPLFNVVLADNH